jgi:hypothetical protein
MSFGRPIFCLFHWGKIVLCVPAALSLSGLFLPPAYAGRIDVAVPAASRNAGITASQTTADFPSQSESMLSPAALRVSRIAEQNGDQDFLMIDKTEGRVIAFEHGTPTFSGAALTGESLTDTIPADAFRKSFSETRGLKYKVTPAGRFTVSRGYDPAYGGTLDVNEIQGKDWNISIHKVWLGAPSEHRDARLRTPAGEDKHITYGCIDVDAETIRQLLRRLPQKARIPIYIVPVDQGLITTLFRPRDAARDNTASIPLSTVPIEISTRKP